MIATKFGRNDALLLATIIFLLLISGFLSLAEMGLSRMTKPKAATLVDKGHRSARALQRLVGEPERWVNPILLTIAICQIVQASLATILFDDVFPGWGLAVGLLFDIVVIFVMVEAIPKTYAVLFPERAALFTARPTLALVSFPPLRLVSKWLIGLTNVLMPGKGLEKGPFVSEQELLGIVEAAAEDEVIEHEERELIESIIEFGDTVVREVMVPRRDMVLVESRLTVTEALDIGIEHGFSRLPVTREDDDDVVGLAYLKDLIAAERDGRGGDSVLTITRSVRFVPENKPVAHVMREMQADKFHMAMVVDEYGGVAGLVTLEDCLEELVGEIVDEYDDEEADIRRLDDGDFLVAGSTPISDVDDLLDIHLPDEDWDTIAGYVLSTLGHVPSVGESVAADGWRFEVVEMDGRRILTLRISLVEADSVASAADS